MGLGLPSGGGDFDRTPIIKYDARAGRLFRIDRSNTSGQWVTDDPVEITNGFQAVMDLENIETGWLNFPAGGAPDIRTVKVGNPLPERPSDKHKAGFRVLMKLGKSLSKSPDGDIREMAANASVSIKGMDALYDAFNAERQNHPGKLPVVGLAKTQAVTTTGQGQSSTNYQPVWEIKSWVPRPSELAADGSPSAPSAQQAAPAAGQATPATNAKDDDEEF